MSFERGVRDDLPDDASMDCSVCWWRYDPQVGDDSRGVPPGTPFRALPPDWCCPGCDAPRWKFMPCV